MQGHWLRLMECLRLRVKDVDLDTNQMVVRAGKGDKDGTQCFLHRTGRCQKRARVARM
jgi:integrase